MTEHVNHPSHYNKPRRKECIEEMLEIFGPEAVYVFCELTAYKYDYRAGGKQGNPAERDTAKAKWYRQYQSELRRQYPDCVNRLLNDYDISFKEVEGG